MSDDKIQTICSDMEKAINLLKNDLSKQLDGIEQFIQNEILEINTKK